MNEILKKHDMIFEDSYDEIIR